MGLTIHYHLKSGAWSTTKARELLARLRGRALDLPFERVDDIVELTGPECNYERYHQDHPHRWLLIQAGAFVDDPRDKHYSYSVIPAHVIAFSTWPGRGCEEANFGLCRYPAFIDVNDRVLRSQNRKVATRRGGWCWGSFCKTQYASNQDCGGVVNFLRCHLAVVRMLDYARELGILQSVSDEGDFWEKRNIPALAREVGEWNAVIARQAGQLKNLLGDAFQAAIIESPNFEHQETAGGQSKEVTS
jgi:hypothetical protein